MSPVTSGVGTPGLGVESWFWPPSEELGRFRGFPMPRFLPPRPSAAVIEMTYMQSCMRDAQRGALNVVGLPERVAAVMADAVMLSQNSQTLAGICACLLVSCNASVKAEVSSSVDVPSVSPSSSCLGAVTL